jgi:hypothetical protein
MTETLVVESDAEKPGGVVDDDVPGRLISLESLDASHRVALPTSVDYQVDSPSA